MSLNLAGCVILDDNRNLYLLHRNKNGADQWELPGGKIEAGETAEQTAKRELYEELGVRVTLVKQIGITSFEENGKEYVYTWFLAEIQEGELSIREPLTFDKLSSFSLQELSTLRLSNNMVKLHNAILSGEVAL